MTLFSIKRVSSYHIALFLSVFVILWVVSGVIFGADEAADDTMIVQSDNVVSTVRVYRSQAQEIPKIIATMGQTKASRQVVLLNEISGKVQERTVPEGAVVKKGDTILKLTTEDRGALLSRAQKNLEQKKIEYNSANELYKKGYVSAAALAEKKADMDEAEASLKRAKLNLENTVITAPFNGVVDEYHVEQGDIAPIGRQLVTILDLKPIEVLAYVSENDVRDVQIGQTAHVTFLDKSKADMTVSYVAAKADPQTRTFPIKLSYKNDDLSILAGLTASLVIPSTKHKAHFVPTSILTLNPEGVIGIKTVDESKKVQFYPVDLVMSSDKGVWVEGLPETVDIIVVGQEFVKIGSVTNVQEIKSPFLVEEGGK